MLQASCNTLLSHVHTLISMLPSGHKILRMDSRLDSDRTQRGQLTSLMQDGEWSHRVHELASALVKYLSAMRLLGMALPDDAEMDIARLAVTSLEVTCWALTNGLNVSSQNVVLALECMSDCLQNQQIFAVIGSSDHMTWACSAIGCVHQIVKKVNPQRKPFSSVDVIVEQQSTLKG